MSRQPSAQELADLAADFRALHLSIQQSGIPASINTRLDAFQQRLDTLTDPTPPEFGH